MKEGFLENERIRLIQEQLCGFLLDEVISPGGRVSCRFVIYNGNGGVSGRDESWTKRTRIWKWKGREKEILNSHYYEKAYL